MQRRDGSLTLYIQHELPFALSAGSPLAITPFEINSTSDNPPIYHSLRSDEVNLVVERSCRQRSRKRSSYYLSLGQCLADLSGHRNGLAGAQDLRAIFSPILVSTAL